MNIPSSIDRDRLLLRLDTFRFVAEANIELLEGDPRLKEQFNSSIQTVLDYLHQLDTHEKSGDATHYAATLNNAELALERVHDVIKRILE